MPRYTLNLLGHELSFRTDVTEDRIEKARNHIEERFADLSSSAKELSKERLLAFLVLSLADDFLESRAKLEEMEQRIAKVLEREIPGAEAD